jgi:flagellar basal-body rod protein FlgG
MSVQTLYTAATGMDAQQTRLDVIANNLANLNTTAFKRARANTEDLFYRQLQLPGMLDSAGEFNPTGVAVGLGARIQSTQTDFGQGAFESTNNPLDVAIEGEGFFQVADPSTGERQYTRAGNFSINANGSLVLGSASTGRLLDPPIQFPPDATEISIASDGFVRYRQPGSTQLQDAGQLELAKFPNPEGLLKLGENLFSETDSSGAAISAIPGNDGAGSMRSTFLEAANVEPVRELIDLITTQRSFELNSQAVQAGDQILQLVATLRR